MDSTILVDELYDKGKVLLESLDREGHKIPLATLIDLEEQGGWFILLGVDRLNESGHRTFYETIYNVIQKNKIDISLNEIKLIDTNAPISITLKGAISTGPGISKFNFFGNYINGAKFPDCIIYRINF
ncbi:hypothetical protein [Mucilaginibacter arboris]|uniref:Uncharacterized protein n=1 Tax=Mucilaginibacter arboris TaxID=2682090 RepID=A0A7K1T198_9SPHI|nr:hypothetical protein [Mucilaginibacter arboris]MVN23346.1 hypothetical protein [Mucilaginibacter arboris]